MDDVKVNIYYNKTEFDYDFDIFYSRNDTFSCTSFECIETESILHSMTTSVIPMSARTGIFPVNITLTDSSGATLHKEWSLKIVNDFEE